MAAPFPKIIIGPMKEQGELSKRGVAIIETVRSIGTTVTAQRVPNVGESDKGQREHYGERIPSLYLMLIYSYTHMGSIFTYRLPVNNTDREESK